MQKLSSFLSTVLVLVTACQQTKAKFKETGSHKTEEAMHSQDSIQVTYTCPMHLEEISMNLENVQNVEWSE
jgi:hypothetical protein